MGGLDEGVAYYQDIGVTTARRNYAVNLLVGVRSGWGTSAANRVTVSLYRGGSAAEAADGVALGSFAALIDSFTSIVAQGEPISAAEFIVDAPLSVGNVLSTGVTVNDGQWHHVTAAYDALAGVARVYVDGRLTNTSAADMTVLEINDQPLTFGSETVTGLIAPYVGLLDDVQIWNYALDAYEVATVYTTVRTEDTICVEVAPMDFDENCRVDLVDFAAFAASWMDCNWIPVDLCLQ